MQMSRAVSSSIELVSGNKSLIGAVAAALLICPTSYAASFGHSRIVSALGQPLQINVQVGQLSTDDVRSFSATPAPASAWTQAGLIPPVDPASMQLELVDGYAPGSKLIQIRSTETFNKPVADLLLDVRTATGHQRYQVSLLTHARPEDAMAPRVDAAVSSASAAPAGLTIHVKRGDTMFAIARRHAVPGVTVYQMMIALQRANPQAFIHDNLNLVKAGATLTMPDKAALTAISDREARRLFQLQAQAFAQYRQRAAAGVGAIAGEAAASGQVTSAVQVPAPAASGAPQDQLRLSGMQTAPGGNQVGATGATDGARADNAEATRKGIADAEQRVSQLEENVKTLNQALHSQGAAASDLVLDSAKGLTQSLAEVADAVTAGNGNVADSAATQAGGGSQAAGDTQAGGDQAVANGQVVGHGASVASGASGGQATTGSGTASNGAGREAAASAGPDSAGKQSGASGASRGATQGGTGGSVANPTAADPSPGANSASGSGSAQGGPASGNPSAGINVPAGNGGQTDGRPDSNASSAADQAAGATESNSTKAEESVSWFQEHMLGIITGALALIVLIIAWLLRRANAARDEGREGNTGPITEAMVKEKLEQINLELEEQQPARPRRDTH